jgi:CubicO group peptidase (beta-lactamase class C family)
MSRSARAVFALLCLLSVGPARGGDAVDELVSAEMKKRQIPGLALAVVRDGKVVKTAAYGLANVELSVPVTDQTVFQIQSVTKCFTATAVMILEEQGKLSVEDRVSKHLEGTPGAWEQITLRHLLTHTSGIKDFINEPTASLRLEVSEEEVLKATAPRPLNFAPGEKYAYSNTNYHLLAMIIRRHTGKAYGEFLKERIFEPLGMGSTRVMSWSQLVPHRASGYVRRAGGLRNGDYVAGSILAYGGGGMLSTAADLAKFDQALDSERLVKRATLERMWTRAKLNDGKESGYGFGWGLGGDSGHRWVSHGGAHMTGFTSSFTRFLDDRISVIVLTNARHANPGLIARRVAGVYVPELAPKRPEPIEDKEPKVTELLKEVSRQIVAGKLVAATYTPALLGELAPQVEALRKEAVRDGEAKRIELLSRTESGGTRTHRYRVTFAARTVVVTLTVDGQEKVSGWWVEAE